MDFMCERHIIDFKIVHHAQAYSQRQMNTNCVRLIYIIYGYIVPKQVWHCDKDESKPKEKVMRLIIDLYIIRVRRTNQSVYK